MKKDLAKKFKSLKRKLLDKNFSTLNKSQREAVFSIKDPVVVLAGAGSGKTTAVVNRIVNMVNYGDAYNTDEIPENLCEETIEKLQQAYDNGDGADTVKDLIKFKEINPKNILSITFTNKAANELKHRLACALGESAEGIWCSTFHSLCSRILRVHADKLGYTNNFTVYDDDDTKKLIKECQKGLKIDDKLLTAKSVKYEISRAKDRLMDAEQYRSEFGGDFRLSGVGAVYEIYQKRLMESDAMDFDDLIVNTTKLFKLFPDVLSRYQNKFEYILADEYQDTNYAQYTLIKLLSEKTCNLCVVGDDDQSIYKFRGASMENIINFENNFPGAKIIKFEQNYRSTKNILAAANAVIENNSIRKGKTLWTENHQGDKIKVHTAYSEHDEAHYIAEVIQDEVAKGAKYSDFAILYRMNSQSNVIEKVFVRCGISYRIFGGVRFYDRKEVRDMMAYLSVINNPKDEVRLRRIINQPRRSIGERTIVQASEISLEEGKDLIHVLRNCEQYDSLQRVSVKLKAFSNLIDEMIYVYKSENMALHELYEMILEKTNYIDYLKTDKETCESRIDNVKELMTNILKYEEERGAEASLPGFLEEISLFADIDNYDENSDAVSMMTLHSAKGLEFPTVFLPGFEEGIFPGIQSLISESDIEEERRLAYVGITRARNKLYILNSDGRMIFGSTSHNKASRFLGEIPEKLIEKTKSRDWKDLKNGEQIPKSAQEMRAQSVLAAHHFGGLGSKSASAASKPEVAAGFKSGDTVYHRTFGEGTVESATAVGNDTLLCIRFAEKFGLKKLMANYAKLEKR